MTDDGTLQRFIQEDLNTVIEIVTGSRVRELEVCNDSFKLLIERSPASEEELVTTEAAVQGPGSRVEAESSAHKIITAPIVGTFYHSEQPGRAALISEGARVEPGALIGVIEAVGVTTEVESEVSGSVTRILSGDGEPVEYGQPLLEVLSDF